MGLQPMPHKNKVWGLNSHKDVIRAKFEKCNICQRNRGYHGNTKLGTLNENTRQGEVLRMNYIP